LCRYLSRRAARQPNWRLCRYDHRCPLIFVDDATSQGLQRRSPLHGRKERVDVGNNGGVADLRCPLASSSNCQRLAVGHGKIPNDRAIRGQGYGTA
jgi:hypothetical protein